MKEIALALTGSVALHAAVFGALVAPAPVVAPRPAVVDMEVTYIARTASAQRAVAARSEPGPLLPRLRGRAREGGQPRRVTATATRTATPTPTATPISTPTSTATPTSNLAWTATPILGGAGLRAGGPLDPTLDLSAFFSRLQRAARRCSGPRSGEGKVRFCVGEGEAPTEVALVQSTGNFALDEAALRCVIPGAAPFPRTDRCLVVPLVFR